MVRTKKIKPNPPTPPGFPSIQLPQFQEPQESLEPILPGIYMTPDDPADPMDCDRYPDSPYCGGMPFTDNFIPKLEPSIVKDDCNLGIQIDFSFAFVKFPPTQIVYRYCQLPEKKDPSIQLENFDNPIFVPDGDGLAFAFASYQLNYEDGMFSHAQPAAYAKDELKQKIIDFQFKDSEILGHLSDGRPYTAYCKLSFDSYYKRNYLWMHTYRDSSNSEDLQKRPNDIWEERLTGTVEVYYLGLNFLFCESSNPKAVFGFDYSVPRIVELSNARSNPSRDYQWFYKHETTYVHRFEELEDTTILSDYQQRNLDLVREGGDFSGKFFVYKSFFMDLEKDLYQILPFNFQPPPPLTPHCCKDMACCPDTSNLEALLKLILKKIGSNDLPATVPKVLTNPGKGTVKIQNLAEFIAYSVKQMDALCGKYPVEIEIEDADLTKEGNQKEKVKLPNIAEALAEIMGLLLIIRTESDATLSATVRGLIETGSTKQIALLAHDYAKANAEYLAYKGKQVEREIPFTFKPDEKQLDKMLKEEKVKVKGWENDDKQDIKDDLAPLLELAAMWKAANFKQVGSGEDSLEKLKSILKNGGDFKEIMKKAFKDAEPKKEPEQEPEKKAHPEWNEFLEEAEQGFISRPGITDVTKPYHRPMKQRPKIKEISKKEPENPPGPSTGG